MIQFNLLPDIKLEYMRARRTKRMVVAVSAISAGVSLAILIVLLLVVFVFQRTYINDLTADITKQSADLKSTTDLDKILTVQNQLNTVGELHKLKPDTTRIMPYLTQLTPIDAKISSVNISYEENAIMITGSAKSLKVINEYVDTLKFTKYTLPPSEGQEFTPVAAFSSVVLSNFGRDTESASYTINANFDPIIFDNTKQVTLIVPDIVTTRSITEKPIDLFEKKDVGN